MCGRYSLTTPVEGLRRLFEVPELPNLAPRYNIAPSQDAPVVRLGQDGRRSLVLMRWGLIPSWAKEAKIGYRMINARAETVAEKPAFRAAFGRRRCLVAADGFYEWRTEGRAKQPYRITLEDGGPFAFAGLWERWRSPEGEIIESFTIVVTEANQHLRPIHDRMPVILDPADHDAWLDVAAELPDRALALLKPFPGERLSIYPVSARVNSPKHEGADVARMAAQPRLL
jgi:putative SOS response-associated peptidase YedK